MLAKAIRKKKRLEKKKHLLSGVTHPNNILTKSPFYLKFNLAFRQSIQYI